MHLAACITDFGLTISNTIRFDFHIYNCHWQRSASWFKPSSSSAIEGFLPLSLMVRTDSKMLWKYRLREFRAPIHLMIGISTLNAETLGHTFVEFLLRQVWCWWSIR